MSLTSRPWTQILSPSCHYTPIYPSALATVVYEMSRRHLTHGGQVKIVLHKGAQHDYRAAGECVEVPFGAAPKRWEKVTDMAIGTGGVARPFASRQYRGAIEATRNSRDVILLHNGSTALPTFKRAAPDALVCLWAHNEFWKSYTRRELQILEGAADRLIMVSQALADMLCEKMGRSSEKIRVVNNGVDIERFAVAPHLDDDAEPVITFIGRVFEPKGPHLLIEAAKILHAQNYRFKVRIVGMVKSPTLAGLPLYQQKLHAMAEPLGDKIEFVDSVDRVRVVEEYHKTSIFCVPSVWADPCPLTVLEAMSCGLATVTTRRGGIPEMAAQSALYFDPNDANSLAQTLIPLIEDPAQRRKWGADARTRAESMSWDQQYQVLLEALS